MRVRGGCAGSRRAHRRRRRRHFVPCMLSVLHVDYARARVLTRRNRVSFPVGRPTLQGRGIKHRAGADAVPFIVF